MKELNFGSDVLLRAAKIADLPEILRVCLETGDSGKDATELHKLPELVGDIYAAPYVIHEPEFAFVLSAGSRVVGYLLGALNTESFENILSDKYWPIVLAKYKVIDFEITNSDRDLLMELVNQGFSDRELTAKFPSHLHIDIVESHQGLGYGKSMISFLLEELKAAGSCGVHLHMSARNERARVFYKKFGFVEVAEDANECILGLVF